MRKGLVILERNEKKMQFPLPFFLTGKFLFATFHSFVIINNTTPTNCHSEEQSDEESQVLTMKQRDSSLPAVVQNDKSNEVSE